MSVELSPECGVAQKRGGDGHQRCAQVDIPLPHAIGILLQKKCGCPCHEGRPPKIRTPVRP
ncbi:hypothetical protein Sipo8835_31940 [Streptomyces ipomoeae]|uniref:Uncharacterized protein n=2 Tax=Streptomyces ipomoeae TaxID=103232 RepID=L1KZ17_9ACTN|nr:hypothetical protein STRIP9103_04471 [Streptomyces ipomoeae 91-03]TQE19902.1 hypothetical protein Sipo7851_43270 [Streptomyces ipomoeae]TQE25162.1 hypothetical protein Sipo8835_31940 [Streptomyces ipomoeae]TQE26237.1 hypothetical protein Sipo7851_33630 [Streptomyces ipomoeae]